MEDNTAEHIGWLWLGCVYLSHRWMHRWMHIDNTAKKPGASKVFYSAGLVTSHHQASPAFEV